MTNEEMQKMMSFIVEQRARFVVNMQEVEETLRRAKERIGENVGAMVKVVNVASQLGEVQTRIDAMSQLATKRAEARKRMEAAQAEGRKRLNSLIVAVERYLSKRTAPGEALEN